MIYMYKYKYINNMDWENMSMYCESIGRPKLYYKYEIYIYIWVSKLIQSQMVSWPFVATVWFVFAPGNVEATV